MLQLIGPQRLEDVAVNSSRLAKNAPQPQGLLTCPAFFGPAEA